MEFLRIYKFLENLIKRNRFYGIKTTIAASFTQYDLERAVHKMPQDDPYDYCYVWTLVAHLHYVYNISWDNIVRALKALSDAVFNKMTGFVFTTTGVGRGVSTILGLDFYFRRHKTKTFNVGEEKALRNEIKGMKLNKRTGFIIGRHTPEHYTYITLDGIEYECAPGHKTVLKGYYLAYRINKV